MAASSSNWEEEMLATLGGESEGASSDDNWSDLDGGDALPLGLEGPAGGGSEHASAATARIDLDGSMESIGSDGLGAMPDAFAPQSAVPVSAPAVASAAHPQAAHASAFEDGLRTPSGEDELDALAQMAQKMGFNPHASPARASASDPFDAPVPAPAPASVPGGMYRCVRDAGATAEFEPDPATVTIKKMYRAGEAFYVSEVRTTTAGTQRALTLDGTWVSLKSASGHQLLEPVDGDPFDLQPPASPGNSNPFAAALSGDQTDFNPFSVDPDPAPTLISAPEPASAAAATGPADAAPVEAEKQKGKQKRIAEVIQNFEAESDGDLALTVGDIIVVTKAKEGEAWWKGYIQGNKKVKGHFPASFVQLLEPEPEPDLPQSSTENPFGATAPTSGPAVGADDDWLTKMSSALDGMENSVAASGEMESINASSIGGPGTASPFMDQPPRTAVAPTLALPSKEDRKSLFDRMDVNGNGALSLAEIDKAIEDGTIPEALMAGNTPSDYNHKPAIMRAYRAADTSGDGFIQRKEFSKLLAYIVYFNNLWDTFDAMDGNHDHRLSIEEFAAGCERVGLSLSPTELRDEFQRCDADGGGFVLFHEFCSWCAEQSLRLRVSTDAYAEGSVSQRLSPSGLQLKPPLARTSLSGPPPADLDTEQARKQAEHRAEIAARALPKQSAQKNRKEDRQSPLGAKRGGFVPPSEERRKMKGFAPVPEEERFSPRRDIENKMSPPNPQLVSPTAASLGKNKSSGADVSRGSNPMRRGENRVGSRDTIFATKSALGHTHIEAEDERTELERTNMPKRAARRVQTHKEEEAKNKPWHYWVQQEMASENKKNAAGPAAQTSVTGTRNAAAGSTRWAQHAQGVGSKGERPDPASMSKTAVITPDHPHASTFKPELAPQTRRIMAGRRDALAAERSSFQHTNYGELLYLDGTEKHAEKMTRQETEAQRMVADKEQMEMEECTFTPVRVTSTKGKYKNYANSVSIIERTNGTMARAKAQQKSEAAISQRQNAELSECTFTPKIKKHRTHKARPAVETRIAQMHDRYAAHIEWISDAQRDRDQQKKKAVPAINKNRAQSPEQRKVHAEQIEKTGGARPVHDRLHTSYQRHVRQPPVDASQPRTGSPTGTHDGGHAAFAGYRDAKPASPTRHRPYDRMEKDIAARRTREEERRAAIQSAVHSHARTRHTLKTSESLSFARAERAMRARFLDADVEGKGSLTKDQLEEALRGLNVLRTTAPKPGSVYKREVGVLEKINLLFDFGDGLLSYRSYEQLLRKVFQSKKDSTVGRQSREQEGGNGTGDEGSPFSDTSERRKEVDEDDESLELLPPDVYDSLVEELIELHAVNKHACATGAGPRKSIRAETVADKVAECTFTPQINHKSRQLERHAAAARSFGGSGIDSTIDSDNSPDEGAESSQQWQQLAREEDRFSRLYEAGQESLSRKEEFAAVMQEERLDAEGCTFWPMLSSTPRRPRRRRPSNLDETDDDNYMQNYVDDDVEDEYLNDVRQSAPVRLSRAELVAMEETTAARREAEELAEATFHPMINSPLSHRRGPSTPGSEATNGMDSSVGDTDVTPAGFDKTVARMRAKRQEEEELEAKAALKRAALASAWGTGGKPTPAKGPSLLERSVEKKQPILKMEVNVGGGKTGLIVIRDGDSPSKLAASFARVWQLDASTEARLTRKLEIQIAKVQQINTDDDPSSAQFSPR